MGPALILSLLAVEELGIGKLVSFVTRLTRHTEVLDFGESLFGNNSNYQRKSIEVVWTWLLRLRKDR